MRLRDLGGLIVVDFIDMEESKNRRDVENRLRDALRQDRARVQFSSISKFGLLELSRQRLRPALSEGSHITCPRCNGTGHIRDTESSALQILRMVQEESMKENTAAVHVQVPVEVTSFLLNEKRTEIAKIELKQRITVLLVPNKHLDTPNYRLERLRHDDPRLENLQVSYSMIEEPDDEVGITRREKFKAKQEPFIKGILPDTPAPVAVPKPEPAPIVAAPTVAAQARAVSPATSGGFFGWLKNLFGGAAAPAPVNAPAEVPVVETKEDRDSRGGRGNRGNGRGGRDGKRDGERSERGERAPRGERGERGDRGERSEAQRAEGREGRNGRRGERTDAPVEASAENSRPPRQERGERGDRGRAQETRPEGATAQRDESRTERGEGRRGPRQQRDTRIDSTVETGADEAVQARAFVDTVPGGESPEAGTETGERTGRRRNRRGGRGGRDRDDTRGTEVAVESDGTAAVAGLVPVVAGADVELAPSNAVDAAPVSAEEGPASEAGEREARRRSRGRGRGDRQRRTEEGEEGQQATVESTGHVAAELTRPVNVLPVDTEVPTLAVVDEAAPALVAAPASVETAPSSPASDRAALQLKAPYALPIGELQAVAEQHGLQWVNSDAEKIRAAQIAIANEPKPVHVPRETKPMVQLDDGPLVLVETRKDLSKVRLPFEAN